MNIFVFNSNDLKAQVKALALKDAHIEYFSTLKEFETIEKTISPKLVILELNANCEKLNQSLMKHHPKVPRLMLFGDCNTIDLKNHQRSQDHANFYLKNLQNGISKIMTELEHEVPDHPETPLAVEDVLSDDALVEKTIANFKFDSKDTGYLETETNQNIQQAFNYVFGKPLQEFPMSDSSNNSDDLPSDNIPIEDDDDGKATVVLDINAMKAELAKNAEEVSSESIDIDFGGSGDSSLGASGDSSLEMASMETGSADLDLGGGLDIDLSSGGEEIEVTNSQGESNDLGGDIGGLELPEASLEVSEAESEPAIETSAQENDLGSGLELSDDLLAPVDEKSPFDAVEDIGEIMAAAPAVEEVAEVSLEDSFSTSAQEVSSGEELNVEYSETDGLDFSASNVEEEVEVAPPPAEKTLTAISQKPKAAPPAEKIVAKAPEKPVVKAAPVKKVVEEVEEVEAAVEELDFGVAPEVPVEEVEEIEMQSQIEEAEELAPPVPVSKAKLTSKKATASSSRTQYDDHQEYVDYHDDELLKLSSTIRSLRDDREILLVKIAKLEEERNGYQQDYVTMKADLDDKKIEISLIKKRHADENNNLRYQLSLSEDKRAMLEEKNKLLRQEFDKLSQKVRVDFSKIQMREKELENQLELLKSDSEIQIRNRDSKILDLKRKIDTLEFDMENITHKESESRNVKLELENKLDKTIKTLRLAITSLEADDEDLKKFELLKKKNLDL